jgi:hypothetical protein
MFLALFAVSLVLAFGISATVAWISKDAIESILHRYLAGRISTAVSKYLRFAIVVAGISDGTRAGALRDYISAPAYTRDELTRQLTPEFWALELYRTALGSLEGILWLMLIFSLGAVVAIVLIRRANLTDLLPHEE